MSNSVERNGKVSIAAGVATGRLRGGVRERRLLTSEIVGHNVFVTWYHDALGLSCAGSAVLAGKTAYA